MPEYIYYLVDMTINGDCFDHKLDAATQAEAEAEALREWERMGRHGQKRREAFYFGRVEASKYEKAMAEDFGNVLPLLENITEFPLRVVNAGGHAIDYEFAVWHMDDDIRERLHADLAPCTAQEFFTAYEQAHAEEFGEEWELSKENPVI